MKARARPSLALDHRGQPCDLIDPAGCDLPLEATAELPDPGLLGRGYRAQVHWTLLVVCAVVMLALVLLVRLLSSLGWVSGLLAAPLALALSGGVYRLVSRPWRRAVAQQIIGVALGFNRCPGCAYPLDDLLPDPDGCLQCPECGAAWRADAVTDQRSRAAATGM